MTLAQNLYDIKLRLCDTFPGLDPIRLLDYPLADVIALTRQHLDHSRRTQPQQDIQDGHRPAGEKTRVIYREADDSWF